MPTWARQRQPKNPAIQPRRRSTMARSLQLPPTPTRRARMWPTRVLTWAAEARDEDRPERDRENSGAGRSACRPCDSGQCGTARAFWICRRDGRVGTDGQCQGGQRDERSCWTDDHDACRDLHGRSSGRKERRNPRADLAPCVANIGDAVIRRRRVHIQRPAFGFLFGNDELPDGIRTAEDLAEVASRWPCTGHAPVMPALVAG